jgi:hypothetical protein
VAGREGAAADRRGATNDCRVLPSTDRVPLSIVRVPQILQRPRQKTIVMRGVDRGGHRSRCMDLHAGPTVGANCHGL